MVQITMIKSDFHMHTVLCDGKNTAEEMILSGIEKGMSKIGISGHAYIDYFEDTDWCMTKESTVLYLNELKRLQEKYADKITIRIGTEWDYYSEGDMKPYEYIIGSLHYVDDGHGRRKAVDDSETVLKTACHEWFNDDYYALAENYYAHEAEIINRTNADIIGHFDLVTKFNEGNRLFDTRNGRYIEAWQRAADALLKTGRPFEINTGAISRGYRTMPYPSADIIDYIGQRGGCFILSSDSHSTATLLYQFDKWEKYCCDHGYTLVSDIIR